MTYHELFMIDLSVEGATDGFDPDRYADIEVTDLTDDDVRREVRERLAEVGLTLEEITAQARRGRFSSHEVRRHWDFIGAFVDYTDVDFDEA